MKTILITGINGYLGSSLAKKFSDNYNIIGLEKSNSPLNRISDFRFKVYEVSDIIPRELFIENKIDIIIHTATTYGRQDESTRSIITSNLLTPIELLDYAVRNSCEAFINTDTALDKFVSTYSLSKKQFQEWLFYRSSDIKAVNIQLEHFFGPGGSPNNFISSMINQMKKNVQSIDLTPGEQLRDFVFISDIVSAYDVILSNLIKIEPNYSSFQVSTDNLISIKELLTSIKIMVGSRTKLNFGALNYRENELMRSQSDNSLLKSLGWKPRVNLEDGLKKILEGDN